MTWLTTLVIAIGLGMDAFAVALAVGCRLPKLSSRHLFRLSFHFGLFQFLMPVIGWYGGSQIRSTSTTSTTGWRSGCSRSSARR